MSGAEKTKKLVSVIMPCHNGQKYLNEAIESVLSQDYEDWELLVINDNSTDFSVDIVEEYEKKDNRIKLLYNTDLQGKPFAPRNYGISNAKGKYIAFLDCDDVWLPTKLSNQIKVFEDTDSAVVFSYYKKMDETGVVRSSIVKSPAKVSYKKYLFGNCIGNLTAVYDTEKVGKVYQKNIHHEDYVMWLEILKKGFSAINTNTVEAIYRESEKSISGNKIDAFKWTWNIYRNELKMNIFNSFFHFIVYAVKAVYKHLK